MYKLHANSAVDPLEIGFRNVRERILHGPLNTYVKVFIDGQLRLRSDITNSTLNPYWDFLSPSKL
jgi:hypothetical protein